MSRSRRKPYLKDKGMTTREYWSQVRKNWNQHLKQNYLDPDLNFESPKSIINDWDYCDWIMNKYKNGRFWYLSKENEIKYSRK